MLPFAPVTFSTRTACPSRYGTRHYNGLILKSAEKRLWLASANYQAFSRSTLFIKLDRAQTEFATAAGVPSAS